MNLLSNSIGNLKLLVNRFLTLYLIKFLKLANILTIEYYAWDIIDPADYKPESNSSVPKDKRNLEGFHSTIMETLYREFERNHELVLPANRRERYLRKGEESELYYNAKPGTKCIAMTEYALQKRKNKRN